MQRQESKWIFGRELKGFSEIVLQGYPDSKEGTRKQGIKRGVMAPLGSQVSKVVFLGHILSEWKKLPYLEAHIT